MKIIPQLDYQAVLANQARPIHFALQLQAPEFTSPRPRPAAFVIVLDHSGSMAGLPLQHAKDAAKVAIRNLRKEDSFALAVFESTARVVIPMQSAANKAAFVPLVDQIAPAGSTNLTGGWMLGRDELAKSPPETSRRLLLLSDGLLNVGIVEPQLALVKIAFSSAQAFLRALSSFSAAMRLPASASKSFTHSDGSSTSEANSTARHAANGRRAHHKCNVEGCPCRMDFSLAASRVMSSSGSATSITFFL